MARTFVGRANEKAALRDLVHRAEHDQVPVAAVVIGAPGSGKTSLLRALGPLIDGAEQIWLCGYELERDVPLACARELLLRLSREAEGDAVERLAFGAHRDGRPVEPVRLFEAVHRALGVVGPTVLLVDDLHWMDNASAALLHYLVRSAKASHQLLVVVATSRPTDGATSFARSYRRLLGATDFLTITLGPLGPAEGATLVRELNPSLDQEAARAVLETAEGSPFWLELLATTGASGPGLSAAMAASLDGVRDDALAALTVLAVTARPTSADDLAAIEGWSSTRARRAADQLVDRGLVQRDPRSLSVVHDLIRHAALSTIPDDQAQRLHRRVGTWLEAAAGDDEQRGLEALEHLQRGAASTTPLAVRLARSARRRLLGEPGLRRLATILDEADPSDPETEALRPLVADLASELGEHSEALRRWSECSSCATDPIVAGRAALRASDAALQLGQRNEAWRHWERARVRSSHDEALRIEALAQEGALWWYLDHRPEEARRAAGTALEAARTLARPTGDTEALDPNTRRALLRGLLAATESARIADDVAMMLAYADELAGLAAGLDERVHAQAVVRGAIALRFLGRNVEAEARLRPMWDSCRRHVMPPAALEVGAWLATVLRSLGRLEEAEAVVTECVALGDRLEEFGPVRAAAVVLPHLLELSRGDWRRAVDGLRAAAAAETDPHYRHHAHRERALALARLDPHHRADEVREAVALALADVDRAGCQRCLVESTTGAAEALARIGDPDAAGSLLETVRVPPADAQNHLALLRARAAVAASRGGDQALAAAAAVIAEAERQSMRMDGLWARLDLAMLMMDGDPRQAVAELHEAGAAAESMGATIEGQRAEQLLRSLGARTWRRGAAADGGQGLAVLTQRELEIARLVSAGATNPEIAGAVFLSRKTVERHVSNILAKLGLRNRAELAALIADRGGEPLAD